MKYKTILVIVGLSTLLSGCEFKYATQENNIMGNLTTTVFDDRNSFEDVEINEIIRNDSQVETRSTQNEDSKFWEHIINQFKNMRWR